MNHLFPVNWQLYKSMRLEITKEDLHIPDILSNPYFFEQDLIKVINEYHGYPTQHDIRSFKDMDLHVDPERPGDSTIKIEGMEKLSYNLWTAINILVNGSSHYSNPVSAHLFIAHAGSPSFDTHTDPDPVFMYVVEGSKTVEVDGVRLKLNAGDGLWIPDNTPHVIYNLESSLMLSIGFDKFHIDKIHV